MGSHPQELGGVAARLLPRTGELVPGVVLLAILEGVEHADYALPRLGGHHAKHRDPVPNMGSRRSGLKSTGVLVQVDQRDDGFSLSQLVT